MNTLNGLPSSLVMRPGETVYGDPVNARSTFSPTCSSRRRPYGPKSSLACTASAPTAFATFGTTVTGSPFTTSNRPSSASSSDARAR